MKIINLTHNDVAIQTAAGRVIIPASGTVAQFINKEKEVGTVYVSTYDGQWVGVPVALRIREGVAGLPPKQVRDTIHIVPEVLLEAIGHNRPDIVAPDTGATAIRDDRGRIIAVTRFVTTAQY